MSTRVCVLTSVHSGGDTRIFRKEAQTLAQAGYQVTLLAPNARPGRTSGVRLRRLTVPAARLRRIALGWRAVLRAALGQQADIYHLHDPELLPVGLVLRMLGKQVVYDVHEDYPEQMLTKHYIPAALRRAVSCIFAAAEKGIAARLDGVVAATDAIAARFRHGHVVTVRNYPRSSRSDGLDRSDPSDTFALRTPFRLVHLAGTLTEERGITSLVRAMEYLDDSFELALAGRFIPAGYEAELRSMAGFRRVRYLGTIPHDEVWRRYRCSDAGLVCLMPLKRYLVSLPVKLFEFMAAELPVVASGFPLFREIVDGSGCGICVDPERPDQIASAVRRLASDRSAAREMGRKGRVAVLQRYDWQSEAQTLLALYEELTCRRPQAAGRKQPGTKVGAHV